MPRVRKADARGKDRGVQLEMPGGAEPAPPGGGSPRRPAEPPRTARGSAGPGGPAARDSTQHADSRKAISTSRQMIRDSRAAFEKSRAAMDRRSHAGGNRPPVILRLGPRDYWVATWLRDEDGEPVYKIAQRGIKAASTAGVLARKLEQERP